MKKLKRGIPVPASGRAALVGAGPGHPGLLTLRGCELLREADVIIYDRLVGPSILNQLEEWNPRAEKIPARREGREGHQDSAAVQEEINRLMVDHAQKGRLVVRLKGGDPFVFGRGGEEASWLARHGVPCEIVPGVTAGTAVPGWAGIPVTDRRFASAVTFLTAHEGAGKTESAISFEALVRVGGTIVSFMGVQTLPALVRSLQDAGLDAGIPVAVIENGTRAEQRTVEGTLATIAAKVKEAGIESPALTVIGPVVTLREELKWFEKKPLYGRTVMMTRARSQAGKLRGRLEVLGARVLEFPAIRIEPPRHFEALDRAIQNLRRFDWVLFTSTNAVESFFGRVRRMGYDARVLAYVKVGVIGEATAEALAAEGLRADLKPERFTSEALVEKLAEMHEIAGRAFLLPRTDIAPPALAESLKKKGGEVTQVTAYRTVADAAGRKLLKKWLQNDKIDFCLFTSASTVDNFFRALGGQTLPEGLRLVSIGPVTSETIRRHGAGVWREAKVHTIEGLLETLQND